MPQQRMPAPGISPHDALVQRTKQLYPFVNNVNPVIIPSNKSGGEAWPAGEDGTPDYPRPKQIPLDRHGIEAGPGSTEADLAGEVLHVDPYAQQIRDQLKQSLTSDQSSYLKREALDYGASGDEDHRMNNAVESAIRGKLVNQWPDEANAKMNYSSEQSGLLNNLSQYMSTGRGPALGSVPINQLPAQAPQSSRMPAP